MPFERVECSVLIVIEITMECHVHAIEWDVRPMFVTLFCVDFSLFAFVYGILHENLANYGITQHTAHIQHSACCNLCSFLFLKQKLLVSIKSVYFFVLLFLWKMFFIVCHHSFALFWTSLVQPFTVFKSKIKNTHSNHIKSFLSQQIWNECEWLKEWIRDRKIERLKENGVELFHHPRTISDSMTNYNLYTIRWVKIFAKNKI